MAEEVNYSNQFFGELTVKIREIEEKQRILKDKLLLIGENLVELKERHDNKIIEIKKDLELVKKNMERLISFLEMATSEFQKFAKK